MIKKNVLLVVVKFFNVYNKEMEKLNRDLLGHIDSFLDYKDTITISRLNKQLHYMITPEHIEKRYKETQMEIIKKFLSRTLLSRYLLTKQFCEKLIHDLEFRRKNFRVHLTDENHVCICFKRNKKPLYRLIKPPLILKYIKRVYPSIFDKYINTTTLEEYRRWFFSFSV